MELNPKKISYSFAINFLTIKNNYLSIKHQSKNGKSVNITDTSNLFPKHNLSSFYLKNPETTGVSNYKYKFSTNSITRPKN